MPVLTVLVPLLGLTGWELLQRHRFTAEADRLQAALQRFADSATFPGEDGRPLPTASGRTSLPYFKWVTSGSETWTERNRVWSVAAVFVNSLGQWRPVQAKFHLRQNRRFLMSGPKLDAAFRDSGDGVFPPLLDALHDFHYLILPQDP